MSPRERMGKVRAYVAPPDGSLAAGSGEGGCEARSGRIDGTKGGGKGSEGWGGKQQPRSGQECCCSVRGALGGDLI